MKNEFTEHFLAARDLPGLIDLRSAVWGADHPHTDPGFFTWLGLDQPVDRAQGILVRDVGGRPSGFAGLRVKEIVVAGPRSKLAHGYEFMVHPGLGDAGKGRIAIRVAQAWIRLARDLGCDFGIVYPNDNSNRILTSRFVGLSPVFRPILLVRPLAGARTEGIEVGLPPWMAGMALRAAATYSSVAARTWQRGPAVDNSDTFDWRFDELWTRMEGIEVGCVRGSEYMTWRFGRHPLYHYHTVVLPSASGIDGFAIGTERLLKGLKTFLVVDLLVQGWERARVRALMTELAGTARDTGCALMASLAIPGTAAFRAFRDAGFISVPTRYAPRTFNSAGMAFTERGNKGADAGAWHFTWGDTDVV